MGAHPGSTTHWVEADWMVDSCSMGAHRINNTLGWLSRLNIMTLLMNSMHCMASEGSDGGDVKALWDKGSPKN